MSYKMKPDPPLTTGDFGTKIEKFKKANNNLIDETKARPFELPKTAVESMRKKTKEFKTSTNRLKTATERYKTAKAK